MNAEPARSLRQLRWGVRAILALGVTASLAANVLHARPDPVARSLSAWSPLALLLAVEMITRVPIHHPALGRLRLTATSCVAAVAAWTSYGHMTNLATRYGETGPTPYLLPISVDGLVLVATISLVEITARIHQNTNLPDTDVHATGTATVTAGLTEPSGNDHVVPARHTTAQVPAQRPSATTAPEPGAIATTGRALPGSASAPAKMLTTAPRSQPTGQPSPTGATTLPQSDVPRAEATPDERHMDNDKRDRVTGATPAHTAAAVAYWRRERPDLHPGEIARLIHRSERTVRRHIASEHTLASSPEL